MKAPIGIFDSGVGGLTVFNEVARLLPFEDLIYLGDSARLPYGTKSPETIRRYAKECAEFLAAENCKLIIIACHTASAHALHFLQKTVSIPVLGMVQPGVALIEESTATNIALLGTPSTLASSAYETLVSSKKNLFPVPCPLFVPLAEEGLHDHALSHAAAHHYLHSLKGSLIEAALLACTHYPLLKNSIQCALGPHVTLLEPAKQCAKQVKNTLLQSKSLHAIGIKGSHTFYTTDSPAYFSRQASLLLKTSLPISVKQVELNKNFNYS